MYLQQIANKIRAHVPPERMPTEDSEGLFVLYAILLRAKGAAVTESDIHDAWSAWIAGQDSSHDSLLPYDLLPPDVQDQDRVFAEAVRLAAREIGAPAGSEQAFYSILFPCGPPVSDSDALQAFELYKMMVESSEALVSRRQSVNTFFLTINGAILSASGLMVQSASAEQVRITSCGVIVLAVAGAILSFAWWSLIRSFGQLNRGKFKVINTLERHFKASIYAAEWEALGRGEDPKVYRSFTSREIWVPSLLIGLHLLAALIAVLIAVGCVSLPGVPVSPSELLPSESRVPTDPSRGCHPALPNQ